MQFQTNDNVVIITVLGMILGFILLFIGEPDLHDALIKLVFSWAGE
jgi:hypothetical protein